MRLENRLIYPDMTAWIVPTSTRNVDINLRELSANLTHSKTNTQNSGMHFLNS